MTQEKRRAAGVNLKDLMAEDKDFLREIVRMTMRQLLEVEITDTLGTEPGECTEARLGYRTGHYPRTLITRVGKLELRVPYDLRRPFLREAVREIPALGGGLGLSARGDTRTRGLHAQGEGHHRGTLPATASPPRP